MAINNDVHGIEQYLLKLDRTVPLDIDITVPRRNLQSEIKEGRNSHKMPEVVEYILRIPRNPEHLSFDAIMAADPQ